MECSAANLLVSETARVLFFEKTNAFNCKKKKKLGEKTENLRTAVFLVPSNAAFIGDQIHIPEKSFISRLNVDYEEPASL